MSRTAVLPAPEPIEPGVPAEPELIDMAPRENAADPARDAANMTRAGGLGTAGGRGAVATAADESDDWEPPAPDVGEEDQSLEASDDDRQGQPPFC